MLIIGQNDKKPNVYGNFVIFFFFFQNSLKLILKLNSLTQIRKTLTQGVNLELC